MNFCGADEAEKPLSLEVQAVHFFYWDTLGQQEWGRCHILELRSVEIDSGQNSGLSEALLRTWKSRKITSCPKPEKQMRTDGCCVAACVMSIHNSWWLTAVRPGRKVNWSRKNGLFLAALGYNLPLGFLDESCFFSLKKSWTHSASVGK